MRCIIAAFLVLLAGLAAPAFAHEDKLAGGEWVLADETGRHPPSLRFGAGRVAGSGGCNRFGGTYALTGDELTFAPLAATRMACPAEIMRKEQDFFAMLGQVRGLGFAGDRLELKDAGGRVLARFVRRVAE